MQRIDERISTDQIVVNASEPKVGDIVIMRYQKVLKVIMHYAVVEGIFDNGDILISECNMWYLYKSGCGYRVISQDYQNLVGFYTP